MQIKLLTDLVSFNVDPQAARVVELLYGKKRVNEFFIAKKLKLTINQTRNLLYRLADSGLVSFIRKKDSKRGGWYTYFWTLDVGRGMVKLKDKLENEKNARDEKIALLKSKRFFVCNSCELVFSEEEALLHDYACGECGDLLNLKDNETEVREIRQKINYIDEKLRKVILEIQDIEGKAVKARARKERVEARKKEEERAKKRKENAKKRKESAKPKKSKPKKAKSGKKFKKTKNSAKKKIKRGFMKKIAKKLKKISRGRR